MTIFIKLLALIVLLSCAFAAQGQGLTQTVRGTITDKISKTPLPGATVIIQNTAPLIGATTDTDGNFKLSRVPVGNQTIKASFIGYKEFELPNVVVNSGKETVLNILMEENIIQMEALIVRPELE